MAVEIIHWNLKGIKTKSNRNYVKKIEIVNDFLENPQQILLLNLQETHLRNEGEIPSKWKEFDHLYSIISTFAQDDDTFAGITIFINKTFEIIKSEILIEGRVMLIKVKNKASSEILHFISVYGRASGDIELRKDIIGKIIDKLKVDKIQDNIFCLGDYNFVCSTLDRNTNILSRNDELCKKIWNDLEKLTCIVDCFRVTNKTKRLYTYTSPTNSKSRIDRIFAPVSWSGRLISTIFENVGVSDHKIVITRFTQIVKKGPGHYVFNNTLLVDEVFGENIRNIIKDYRENANSYGNYITLWEFLKMAMLGYAQMFSIEKSRERKREYFNANANISLIESIPKDKLTPSMVNELEYHKQIAIKYLNFKRSGSILRAKIVNFEENEVKILYISKIEKLKGESNTVTSLIDEDGILKEGTKNVMDVIYNFYSNLYKKEIEDITEQNYFLRNINKRLPREDKDMLDQPLCLDEIHKSLKDMKCNKSPGDDSLTKEFYLHFWDELAPIYLRCVSEIKEVKDLCPSQKRGLITLAYKKNGREFLKNYRPISLQNIDLKMITRALAKRLTAVIKHLIEKNQKCLPGRKISTNVHILQDLIDYINKNDYQAILLFFDNEKAYDRISHSFLIKTLRHFDFGENFIDWIKIIYKDSSSSVKVNGFSTKYFPIERGLRQGCPLSSLLYVLCAEVLCLEIRSNRKIVGVKYDNKEHKELSYADDLSIVITEIDSIDDIFETLRKFGKATNSKINVDKTEALWLGKWKNNSIKPRNLKWSNTMVKSVGIYFGNDRGEAEKQGFEEIKEKIKNKLKFWRGKGISLKGRVKVINTFITSKLWYTCEVQDVANNIKQEIYELLLDFIWERGYHQRSKRGIQDDYHKGGLRLCNIETRINAFRVKWISHILESDRNSIEFFLANKLISDKFNLGLNILKGYTIGCIKTISNKFYRNACIAWNKLNIIFQPKDERSIENLWIYENILLKDDDGRIYKPPGARKMRNMPKIFSDLPFPIINRNREEATIIRSLNLAYNSIQWARNNTFVMNRGNNVLVIKDLTFREIYWTYFENDVIQQPWKTKWEQILSNNDVEWDKVWNNVHNQMFSYVVQSSLWMMVNLNYISAYKLNRMYNNINICCQCESPEEGPAHVFLYCEVSNLVYMHFDNVLQQISPLSVSTEERAFGLLINNINVEKRKTLRNYF